jgi:hypothetical protein
MHRAIMSEQWEWSLRKTVSPAAIRATTPRTTGCDALRPAALRELAEERTGSHDRGAQGLAA